MEEQMQQIEGAGILSALAKMFFKGLDKAISDVSEYESEMGILKQVSRINLVDNKTGEEYTLTIKLSPIKDRDNYYYIEAETDAPGLDVSSINGRGVKLDSSNTKDFKKMIDKLLNETGLKATNMSGDESKESEEFGESEIDSEDESEGTKGSVFKEGEVQSLIEAAQKWLKERPVMAIADEGYVSINVEFTDNSSTDVCIITIDASIDGKDITRIKPKEYEINTTDEDGNVISEQDFLQSIQSSIDEFAKDNRLSNVQHLRASTIVDATFLKDSKNGEISITAINASTDLNTAMNVIYELAEDQEFADSLGDDTEQSFRISDDGESWDVEPVDSIDVSDSYCDLFKEVCIANSTLSTYQWAVGYSAWSNDSFLSNCLYQISTLLDNCAIWVINHTNKFPNVIGTFGNDLTDLNDLKEEDQVSMQKVHDSAKSLLEGLLEILDIYYVNLDHNEQKAIDDFMNEANRLLAYA